METILFQGDSITDCGRDRSNSENLGNGYPRLVQAHLGFEHPRAYRVLNRGVSGDRIPDVYARIVRDIIAIQPDYMSLLIGVNDVWHGIDANNGTTVRRFEKIYRMLLEELRTELPKMKIMILEPFVLEGSATANRPDQTDRFSVFQNGVAQMAQVARAAALSYDLPFVALQEAFDAALTRGPADCWLLDGVHPTAAGHELIKREWLKTFQTLRCP